MVEVARSKTQMIEDARVRATFESVPHTERKEIVAAATRVAVAVEGVKPLPPHRRSNRTKAGHDGSEPVLIDPRDLPNWEKDKEGEAPRENINSDPILFLYRSKRIEGHMFHAARAFREDWRVSLIMPGASSVMVGNGGSGGGAVLPNDAKVDAMRRRGDAIESIPPECRAIIERVVLDDQSISKAAAGLRVHRQAAGMCLNIGLNALARFYGYAS